MLFKAPFEPPSSLNEKNHHGSFSNTTKIRSQQPDRHDLNSEISLMHLDKIQQKVSSVGFSVPIPIRFLFRCEQSRKRMLRVVVKGSRRRRRNRGSDRRRCCSSGTYVRTGCYYRRRTNKSTEGFFCMSQHCSASRLATGQQHTSHVATRTNTKLRVVASCFYWR